MQHQPVMTEEILEALNLKEEAVILDGTVGYGGHAEAILTHLKGKATYIGFDRDQDALNASKERLAKFPDVRLVHASYAKAPEVFAQEGWGALDAVLLDLGASSPQFDNSDRGFSFREDGPLDMRFDVSGGNTAADILNTYQEDDLAGLIKTFGEERFAKKIASAIVQRRKEQPFSRTGELVSLIESVIPKRLWPKNIHPATRTFQALRIEVNNELAQAEQAIPDLLGMLKSKGRMAVISFHSLEDRLVKQAFKEAEKDCVCPKEFPICTCEKEQLAKIITKKPLVPQKTEIKQNVRSRSAKLRVAERI